MIVYFIYVFFSFLLIFFGYLLKTKLIYHCEFKNNAIIIFLLFVYGLFLGFVHMHILSDGEVVFFDSLNKYIIRNDFVRYTAILFVIGHILVLPSGMTKKYKRKW